VGIEEEVMLVDPRSWQLTQRADELLSVLDGELARACSAETHEGAIELKTMPHHTVGEAVGELRELREQLARAAAQLGIAVATSGMHPAPMTEPTRVSPADRAQVIDRTMRELARREPTFALHVHVGVPDAESGIRLFNRLRAHLPMLLALSASSPFWRGNATGLASNRTVLFQAFPRTGLPRNFDGYADWVETVDVLIRSGAIPEPTFLWWDIRPQPLLGTVEVRVMDAQPRVAETAALCALVQALARLELERDDAPPPPIPQEIVNESRFLAARDGPAARLIDPLGSAGVPVATLVRDALAAAAPHARALGAERELALVPGLVSSPEAVRQLAVAEAGGLPALVEDLASRFSDATRMGGSG
jgi:carboxylate-amine ligase